MQNEPPEPTAREQLEIHRPMKYVVLVLDLDQQELASETQGLYNTAEEAKEETDKYLQQSAREGQFLYSPLEWEEQKPNNQERFVAWDEALRWSITEVADFTKGC